MTPEKLRALLDAVASGSRSPKDALDELSVAPVKDLGYARLDVHRELRSGAPEAIYGAGKTPAELAGLTQALLDNDQDVLITRVPSGGAEAVLSVAADAVWHERSRCLTVTRRERVVAGTLGVVAAGTSDRPVSEEAAVAARFYGVSVEEIADVGVAGVHRVLAEVERLRAFDVVIVCAGMDGALPSVVGGLVAAPVIAVPTSVGYGASFGGVSALLATLNACAAGITVVNIDNGFGAARAALRILGRMQRAEP